MDAQAPSQASRRRRSIGAENGMPIAYTAGTSAVPSMSRRALRLMTALVTVHVPAVSTASALPALPDVPTIAEAGFPSWGGRTFFAKWCAFA